MITRSGSTMRSRIFAFWYLGFFSMKGHKDLVTSVTAWWNSVSAGWRALSWARNWESSWDMVLWIQSGVGVTVCAGQSSERGVAALVGAYAHSLLDRKDEDLSIADLSRLCGLDDGLDRAGDEVVGDGDLDLHLREKIDSVLA